MEIRYNRVTTIILAILFLSAPVLARGYAIGKVVDSVTQQPIRGAIVTASGEVAVTDEKGVFLIKALSRKVSVRAYGYARTEQGAPSPLLTAPSLIPLTPFTPKALYLSAYGIGSKKLRSSALSLIEETELNSLVIDVKGDRGFLTFKSEIPLASEIGAQKIILVKDMQGLMRTLKERGIYTIARIVVFKDNPLALARPDLAVKTMDGKIWRDRENLAWTDPFKKEVWEYNLAIAEEAARYGFDEIQFDYVRFPDSKGVQFSMPSTEESRVKALSGFLSEAKKRLMPYNVFLAADIFGYVCLNLNDTHIGQRLEDLVPHLEYFSFMLYPTGFQFGIPGFRNPVAHPHEIVYLSLKRAAERTKLPPVRFRPWLQAFRDYAFDRRPFGGKEILEQIEAAERIGTNGWMLWNPHNNYSREGLRRQGVQFVSY